MAERLECPDWIPNDVVEYVEAHTKELLLTYHFCNPLKQPLIKRPENKDA